MAQSTDRTAASEPAEPANVSIRVYLSPDLKFALQLAATYDRTDVSKYVAALIQNDPKVRKHLK